MKNLWYIENKERDNYKTGCFVTKGEAIYRLNEMINEPFYNCGFSVISRTNDMVRLSDNSIFRVVKL